MYAITGKGIKRRYKEGRADLVIDAHIQITSIINN